MIILALLTGLLLIGLVICFYLACLFISSTKREEAEVQALYEQFFSIHNKFLSDNTVDSERAYLESQYGLDNYVRGLRRKDAK